MRGVIKAYLLVRNLVDEREQYRVYAILLL